MGWVVGLACVNYKKHCRNLFLRMRAEMKKAVTKNRGSKQTITFQYDPSSYALNFDDGCSEFREETDAFHPIEARNFPSNHSSTYIFVVRVK